MSYSKHTSGSIQVDRRRGASRVAHPISRARWYRQTTLAIPDQPRIIRDIRISKILPTLSSDFAPTLFCLGVLFVAFLIW